LSLETPLSLLEKEFMMTARIARNRFRKGFTLVELLVVIGIIALLISILLPSLSKARESANTVKCLANMRQIGQANYLYSSENHGYCVPAGWRGTTAGSEDESWPNILVNSGYLNAPNVTGSGGGIASVFYCPSGNPDFNGAFTSSSGPAAVPPSDTDGQGATARRCHSVASGTNVDCWYGINGSTGSDITSVPCHRVPDDNVPLGTNDYRAMLKMTTVRRSAETVFIFDGLYMNLNLNSARINARHARNKKTNLCFFDGHVATYNTIELPGGNLPAGTGNLFIKANLDANYPSPAPKWTLDQN
jgi:prepilin-type N-terminal cleavage/methylation domain-containing protein/prepilin-type processing-associated H-X9-DG protein